MRDALTAAREWGAQPMDMLGIPSRPWSEANRYLAQALTLHDKDLCPGGCGHYLDDTSGADADGWFECESTYCDACRARDDNKDQPQPGELRYVVDTRPS